MSILRERMIQDMQPRGFSPRTQESYIRAVRKLAEHYHKSPDLITDEELREYFLYRTQCQPVVTGSMHYRPLWNQVLL